MGFFAGIVPRNHRSIVYVSSCYQHFLSKKLTVLCNYDGLVVLGNSGTHTHTLTHVNANASAHTHTHTGSRSHTLCLSLTHAHAYRFIPIVKNYCRNQVNTLSHLADFSVFHQRHVDEIFFFGFSSLNHFVELMILSMVYKSSFDKTSVDEK